MMVSESTALLMAERLAEALLVSGSKLVTAESCTGGGIGYVLTSIAGSSQWYERGFITYSNESKRELLGVSAHTLDSHGAVSEQTAAAMAQGAIDNSHADISVAVSGVAGPTGGSKNTPVGSVCFGWSERDGETKTVRIVFEGGRQQVREQSILMAIQGLLDVLGNSSQGLV